MMTWEDADTDGPDADYYYEEEDVLIAEVTHTCCGKVQSYWNCNSEDVPSPETVCRDCQPQPALGGDDFVDPFGEG